MHKITPRLVIIGMVLILAILTPAQEPVRLSAPAVTCADIPNPVTNGTQLTNAIIAANDETLCPGADIIDLDGNIITAFSIPVIQTDMTLRNGTLSATRFEATDVRLEFLNIDIPNEGNSASVVESGANSNLVITDSRFNAVALRAGGSLTIRNSSFGGVFNFTAITADDLQVYNSTIHGNTNPLISKDYAYRPIETNTLTSVNSRFVDNSGLQIIFADEVRFINTIFARNFTIFSVHIHAKVMMDTYNSTFYANTSGDAYNNQPTQPSPLFSNGRNVVNNVAWANESGTTPLGDGISYNALPYSVPNGSNNIVLTSDPFVGTPQYFIPRVDAPIVNTGNTAALPADMSDMDEDGNITEPIPYDVSGSPRVRGTTVDMGAREYNPNIVKITDTVAHRFTNEPFEGAVVDIEGSMLSGVTDANGQYEIYQTEMKK